MLKDYLKNIGFQKFTQYNQRVINEFVKQVFLRDHSAFTSEEIKKLYTYQIPELSPDGSCSISAHPAKEPYNLAPLYGLEYNTKVLQMHPKTLYLWRLGRIIQNLQNLTGVDWLGIYKKTHNLDGESILLKETYYGAISRPEFPLTEDFAKKSNNSTVGLSGKAILVQNVDDYKGPYYECDNKVQSEFCCPILNKKNEVVGIIDAESFEPNFFNDQKILEITKVCMDLGKINF